MKHFSRVLMVAAMLAVAGLGLSACSNADFAAMPNNAGIQAPSSGLVGDEEVADVENTEGDGVVDVDVDQDEDDVDVESSDAADPLEITTDALEGGTVGVSYKDELKAHGGSRSYRWSVASGTLPAGLQLCEKDGDNCGTLVSGRDASISGTPDAVTARSVFVLRIVDAEDDSLEPAEKSFSIAVNSAEADEPEEQKPVTVVGAGVAMTGINMNLTNLPQTVQLNEILSFPAQLAGILTTPIMSTLTIEGAKAPYEFKVVTQGFGVVAAQEDGSFKLVITHLYPLFKDVDHDPEIPVTVLVRDANGRTAKLEKTIKVVYPMDKVTDLRMKICFDADGTCSDSGLNTLSLIVVKGENAYAGYCLGTDESTAEVRLDECTEATETGDQAIPGLGYTWIGQTIRLDEVQKILYWQFMVELGDKLYMTSDYWRATYKIGTPGDAVGTHDDITDVVEKTPLGKIWHRRPEKLLIFMNSAIARMAAMQTEIDDFLAGN